MIAIAAPIVLLSLGLLYGCSSGSDSASTSGAPSTNTATTPGVAQALPSLRIWTQGGAPIVSTDDYVPATFSLTSEDGRVLLSDTTEIRGHGHTTWTMMPKKPYRLKLTNSSEILGMPANKHWVLLANYSDKTLMRNVVAFQLSEWTGMEWTPRSKFVDVELNGVYQGVYQLTEHVRIGSDRVNIPTLKIGDTAPDRITGGYLLEVDNTRDEALCINAATPGMTFCVKDPETLLDPGWEAQRAYIQDYLARAEAALFSPDFTDPVLGYGAFFDVDSVVNWYLVNEIAKNLDADMDRSTYIAKKRNGKLTFGPVWDYDLAFGNTVFADCDLPHGWYVRQSPWFQRMFQDPAFEAKVKAKWAQLKSAGRIDELLSTVDQQSLYLSKVQVKNFQTWDILSIWVWDNRVVTGSYPGEVAAFRDWLRDRLIWMDHELAP